MTRLAPTHRIRAWGGAAERALGANGRVLAAFERSLYLATARGLACLGDIGCGPLNAPLDRPVARVGRGTLVEREGPLVLIGHEMAVCLDDARPWRPRQVPPWNAAAIRRSLARVAALDAPSEGLAPLLRPLAAAHTGAERRFGGRHDGFFRRSYHPPGRKKAPVMAARKREAMKPASAAIEDVSIPKSSLLRAHRLSRDHNDCRTGTASLAAIAVRECTIKIHGITFGEERVLAVNVHGKLSTEQVDYLCA